MSASATRTEQERQAHFRAVIKGGARDALIAVGLYGTSYLALNRFRPALWQRMTPPIKINIGAIITLMGFFYGTDRASSDFTSLTGSSTSMTETESRHIPVLRAKEDSTLDRIIDKLEDVGHRDQKIPKGKRSFISRG